MDVGVRALRHRAGGPGRPPAGKRGDCGTTLGTGRRGPHRDRGERGVPFPQRPAAQSRTGLFRPGGHAAAIGRQAILVGESSARLRGGAVTAGADYAHHHPSGSGPERGGGDLHGAAQQSESSGDRAASGQWRGYADGGNDERNHERGGRSSRAAARAGLGESEFGSVFVLFKAGPVDAKPAAGEGCAASESNPAGPACDSRGIRVQAARAIARMGTPPTAAR